LDGSRNRRETTQTSASRDRHPSAWLSDKSKLKTNQRIRSENEAVDVIDMCASSQHLMFAEDANSTFVQ